MMPPVQSEHGSPGRSDLANRQAVHGHHGPVRRPHTAAVLIGPSSRVRGDGRSFTACESLAAGGVLNGGFRIRTNS